MSKICPLCKDDNIDSAVKCNNCGETFSKNKYVWKIHCPVCGREYDVKDENSTIKVCDCCEDEIDKYKIKDEVPYKTLVKNVVSEEKIVSPVLIMTEKSGKVIKISGNCILGRRGDVESEFFDDEKRHVSERHCKIILENNEYFVESLPTTNHTKINNNILGKGIRKIIRDGNRLTIADKIFDISIQSESK